MSYTNLLYHIVYTTKERAPLITQTLRPRLHEYLGGTVRGLGGIALEIDGTADHVHILAKHTISISIDLTCGDNSVASFAGFVVFCVNFPGSAAPRQGLHSGRLLAQAS